MNPTPKITSTRDEAATQWMEKYSSPGDFEEYGQQEAFFAGWNAAESRLKEDNRKLLEALKEIRGTTRPNGDTAVQRMVRYQQDIADEAIKEHESRQGQGE